MKAQAFVKLEEGDRIVCVAGPEEGLELTVQCVIPEDGREQLSHEIGASFSDFGEWHWIFVDEREAWAIARAGATNGTGGNG